MGALYSGRCYSTAADAASAMWSGVEPVLSTASPPSVSTVEFATGWYLVTRESGAITAAVALPSVEFAACDPGQSVADGVELAFLVVAVWAAAWAVSYLAMPIRGKA